MAPISHAVREHVLCVEPIEDIDYSVLQLLPDRTHMQHELFVVQRADLLRGGLVKDCPRVDPGVKRDGQLLLVQQLRRRLCPANDLMQTKLQDVSLADRVEKTEKLGCVGGSEYSCVFLRIPIQQLNIHIGACGPCFTAGGIAAPMAFVGRRCTLRGKWHNVTSPDPHTLVP